MAKIQADNKNIEKYFAKVKKIGSITLDDTALVSAGVELNFFDRKLTTTQQNKLKTDVLKILDENFYGSYEIGKVKIDGSDSLLSINVTQGGVAGSVPTAIQEAGSAFILTQVLKNNKKF